MDATNPAPTQDPPLIDRRKLGIFVVLGIADYRELLADLIAEVPEQLERLRQIIGQGDSGERKTCAHSLRGILGYFGCIAMTQRFAQLENEDDVPPELADTIHAELLTLWEDSLAAIREWQQSVPGFSS